MAAIFSSSVMALFIWLMAVPDVLDVETLVVCSFRPAFFAATGILPVTYRAALPAPGLAAG